MTRTIENINPIEAAEQLKADPSTVIIDVRSRVEYEFVGHPINAVHIAWKEFPQWQVNENFCTEVGAALAARNAEHGAADKSDDKSTPLLMICRSGARSAEAGKRLLEDGYQNVTNIAEGFEGDKDDNNHRGKVNGWRFHGLPWEQG